MPEPSDKQMMMRDIRTRRFNRHPIGPVPTLGELQRGTPWVWIYCEQRKCLHHAPMAIAPAVILWGPDATSNLLRERARCTRCGHKGDAVLKHPSWEGAAVGFAAFPIEGADHAAP